MCAQAGGAKVATTLAREVNAARRAAGVSQMIDTIDIGGGLPVSWGTAEQRPSFSDYAAALREGVPELFTDEFPRVVTEMGAAMHCRFGWVGSVVEVTKDVSKEHVIAMIHAGSDVFARQCYAPNMRLPHPIYAYTSDGMPKQSKAADGDGEAGDVVEHDIAGPLCFSGDIVAPGVPLPRLRVGDIVVLDEAGGNCLSISTTHCSRRRPPVFGYSSSAVLRDRAVALAARGEAVPDGGDGGDGLHFALLVPGASIDDTLRIWG